MDEIEKKEKLADLCHKQWSGWLKYLFSKCTAPDEIDFNAEEDFVVIPKWAVDRWTKQMKTDYKDLPENEKESDRKEADKIIELLKEFEK